MNTSILRDEYDFFLHIKPKRRKIVKVSLSKDELCLV